MMKQSDTKRSSSLPSSIVCYADQDSIADNNEDDSCVTRERMHTYHLADQQEIIKFKLQFARQQEMLDNLSLKLSKCEVEIDALKTENAVLIDERALAAAPPVRSKGWFSSSECRGSMQMLISVNAKYMTDNSRLQVERDVLRASFRSYVKDSHRIVTALQKENDALQHRLQDDDETDKESFKELSMYPLDPFEKWKKSFSEVTSSTLPSDISDFGDDYETQSKCFQKWLQNQMQGVHVESDDGIQGEIKKCSGGARESQDLLVDFGETPRPTRTSISLSRSMPLICGTSEELLKVGKMRWSFIG
jgi:hypothetical protein